MKKHSQCESKHYFHLRNNKIYPSKAKQATMFCWLVGWLVVFFRTPSLFFYGFFHKKNPIINNRSERIENFHQTELLPPSLCNRYGKKDKKNFMIDEFFFLLVQFFFLWSKNEFNFRFFGSVSERKAKNFSFFLINTNTKEWFSFAPCSLFFFRFPIWNG